MKTNNTIARIATAAIAMIAGAVTARAAERTLMLLQENYSGSSYLDDALNDEQRPVVEPVVDPIIDGMAESLSTAKLRLIAADRSKYQHFVNLTDTRCTRANLLDNLIAETRAGHIVDLVFLGHGNIETMNLHSGEQLTGATGGHLAMVPVPGTNPARFTVAFTYSDPGNIRSLLTDARARCGASFNFNLRLVYSCACDGSTLNDDWLAIGARTSVGSLRHNYMAEPMITNFWLDFVYNDKRVIQAADDSWGAAAGFWTSIPFLGQSFFNSVNPDSSAGTTPVVDSAQVTVGNGNLIFNDEYQMALNETRNITVSATRTHTFPIYTCAGETYSFSVAGNDVWSNTGLFGPIIVNANGYTPGFADGARRVQNANMMALCGERFTHPDAANPFNFIGGSGFRIGTSRTVNTGYGFLNLFANDNILGYGDNGGSIRVTVRRIR